MRAQFFLSIFPSTIGNTTAFLNTNPHQAARVWCYCQSTIEPSVRRCCFEDSTIWARKLEHPANHKKNGLLKIMFRIERGWGSFLSRKRWLIKLFINKEIRSIFGEISTQLSDHTCSTSFCVRQWKRVRERERDEKSNQVRVRERGLTAVRPDFGLKSSQMSTNGCSENSQSSLFLKSDAF